MPEPENARVEDLDRVKRDVQQLREELKEQEHSVLRALRTLMRDVSDYQSGKRSEFPNSAFLGLAFAYLRPRIILVVGSIAATVFAAAQIMVLIGQNTLIEQQNKLIEQQTRSNRVEAVTSLVQGIGAEEPTDLQIAQLVVFGSEGFDVLLELARFPTDSGSTSRAMLLRTANQHSPSQAAQVYMLLFYEYTWAVADAIGWPVREIDSGWFINWSALSTTGWNIELSDEAKTAIAGSFDNVVEYSTAHRYFDHEYTEAFAALVNELPLEFYEYYKFSISSLGTTRKATPDLLQHAWLVSDHITTVCRIVSNHEILFQDRDTAAPTPTILSDLQFLNNSGKRRSTYDSVEKWFEANCQPS